MVAAVFLGSFIHDTTLTLLATLGISSLFLFAGLEIDLDDFGRGKWHLLAHIVGCSATLTALVYLAMHYFGFSWQVAALMALAVVTPSTGFILDTLPSLDVSSDAPHQSRQR